VTSADNQQERPDIVSENIPDEIGFYLAGFVDGEGSFNVSIKKVNDRSLGWRVTACFNVSQRERQILELLQQTLGCGTIRKRWDGVHYFEVNSYIDLVERVIPFFRRFLLRSPSKNQTLEIFAEICEIMCTREHLSSDGIRKIVYLRSLMNNETSKRHRDDEEILNSLS
jgi:LAGLIDADG endonuclease